MIESLRHLSTRQRVGGIAFALATGAVFGNGLVQGDEEAAAPAPRQRALPLGCCRWTSCAESP